MTSFASNLVITTLIIVFAALTFYFKYKKELSNVNEEDDGTDYSIQNLAGKLQDTFNNIVNTNVNELGYNETETKKREKQKAELSRALRNCSFGNPGEKEYIKDYMMDLLQRYFKINENTINRVLSFADETRLTPQDKFEILLYNYRKQLDGYAIEQIIVNVPYEKEYEDGIYYEINKEDIDEIYAQERPVLSYLDKLEVITQRIYEVSRGLGPVDELRDQKCLDGVSGGVSGITSEDYNYMEDIVNDNESREIFRHDSIWILWHGKSIHLSFLSFGTEKELRRVCKNIYRYDAPYYLSGIKGKVVAEDKKGNRITVVRPPFADSWKFFVRKFESVSSVNSLTIEKLITDPGCEIVIKTLSYIIMGSFSVITGNMADGKTTLLKALIKFIPPTLNIRVEEDVFETCLNRIYPKRNINSFRKTDYISIEDGMVLIKKTDGDVIILGEVTEQLTAAALMQIAEISKISICTTHQATTQKMIEYFRNAGLAMHMFSNEAVAEEQVANAIQWDIHMDRDRRAGHRYIARITEIIPKETEDIAEDVPVNEALKQFCRKMTRTRSYDTRDIIVYENGQYAVKNKISERSLLNIRKILYEKSDPALNEFNEFYDRYFERSAPDDLTA